MTRICGKICGCEEQNNKVIHSRYAQNGIHGCIGRQNSRGDLFMSDFW